MYTRKPIIIELPKKDSIVQWENLTDAHVGNADFREDIFADRIKTIIDDPLRYTSFGGDQWDLILPKGDPRYNDESVKMRTFTKQIDHFNDLCSDLFAEHNRFQKYYGAEKIWYLQWGNHEWNSRIIDEDYMRSYCRDRKIKFLGARAMFRIDIRYKGQSMMKKDLFVTHGAGSSANAIKALDDLAVNVNADVYMMGHLHKTCGDRQLVQYYNRKKDKWGQKRILKVNGGCFTDSLAEGKDSWLEHVKNKLILSEAGTVTVSFDAYKDKMRFHM